MINHDESDLAGLSDQIGTLTPPTTAQLADALSFVNRHAQDDADRDQLVAALGLDAA